MNICKHISLATRALISAVCFSAITSHADYREFTNTKGQKLKAKVVMLSGEDATLEREDGKLFVLKKKLFCSADNEYFNNWKHPDLFHADNFSVSIELKNKEIDMKAMSTNKKHLANKQDVFWYNLTIDSKNNKPIDGLRMEYAIYRKNKMIDYLSPTIVWKEDIESIGPNSVHIAKTGDILVKRSAKQQRDNNLDIHGIWLKLYQGDKLIKDITYPEKMHFGQWPVTWIPPKQFASK